MSKMTKKIKRLNTPSEIYLLRFSNGMRLIAFVVETKKHFHLFNPMRIDDIMEGGKKGYNLVPFQPSKIVESSNTVIRKKDAMLFEVTTEFKQHYADALIEEEEPKETPKKIKSTKKSVDNDANGVIVFSNFRKFQEHANTGDPEPPDIA